MFWGWEVCHKTVMLPVCSGHSCNFHLLLLMQKSHHLHKQKMAHVAAAFDFFYCGHVTSPCMVQVLSLTVTFNEPPMAKWPVCCPSRTWDMADGSLHSNWACGWEGPTLIVLYFPSWAAVGMHCVTKTKNDSKMEVVKNRLDHLFWNIKSYI